MHKFTPERRLTGGIRLPAHKAGSTSRAIRRGLLPPRLIVSTRQHAGPPATPVVETGQAVSRGERIARADAIESADVHAPASGTVVAIEPHDAPLASEVTTETCIVIETDGEDRTAVPDRPIEPGASFDERIRQIASAGIVGLGGAVYPMAAKIRAEPDPACELLIVNGAECEPYISCDDMLMRESPEEVLSGAALLAELVAARECIVAIERDKPLAIEAMTAAAEKLGIERLSIAELPSVYPAGGERQLVEVLAGVEVPAGRFPSDAGYLCQNVGTAYAVHRYFRHGEPLMSRIVTVTGSAVTAPCNVEALIGTPIAELIEACGGYRGEAARLIQGGSMMGFTLASDALPITKATNCIIAAAAAEIQTEEREWPCIRCGECALACPARLQPQDLLIAARHEDAAGLVELALSECIECGCCDIVCPSHIPLTREFQDAKPLLKRFGERQAIAQAADRRYRLREQRRRDALLAEDRRREEIKRTLGAKEERDAEISAAVERARRRKTESDGG